MTQKILTFFLIAMLMFFTACGNTGTENTPLSPAELSAHPTESTATPSPTPSDPPAEPLNLVGEWIQVDGNSEESYHTATITSDTITITWVMPDFSMIYWAGSYIPPETEETSYTWESMGDPEKMEQSLLASNDETKVFTYQNGKLSYELTALGKTTTIYLEQQP